jgi:hypothetical protein
MVMINFSNFRQQVHVTKQGRINGDKIYALTRYVSARLSYLIVVLFPNVRPNQISVFLIIILLGLIISNIFYDIISSFYLIIIQLFFLQLVAIGDRVDGEVARYKSYFTQTGIYYDRFFHFLYPFALYLSIGYFFATATGFSTIIIFAVVLSVFASLTNMLGKLRHHIKHKIKLEHHDDLLQDLYDQPVLIPAQGLIKRLSHYFIFMMYDWVWALYLIIIILFSFFAQLAFVIYVAHSLVSLMVILYYILVTYPQNFLFSKKDFS